MLVFDVLFVVLKHLRRVIPSAKVPSLVEVPVDHIEEPSRRSMRTLCLGLNAFGV